MTIRAISVGMCANDAIYTVDEIPSHPTKVLATRLIQSGGGMGANAAVAAARLGAQVQYWGRVGDDELGHRITDDIAAAGVDVSQVRRIPNCVSPAAAIIVDGRGERLICAFNDPALDHDTRWLDLDRVAAVDVVMCDVRWPSASARVLDRARAEGRIALLDADIGPPEDLADLVPRATHVAFSEGGLAALVPGLGPGAALQRVARMTSALVGVTLGPEGFLWLDDGQEHHAPGLPIRAVDTLAAGDVWHAAYAIALAEGMSVAAAAGFANTAAAIKCERPGGRSGAPSRAEVNARLQKSRGAR